MTDAPPDAGTAPTPSPPPSPSGAPVWVTIVVILSLTALLAYNIVIVGPEGLPNSYIVGGLLAAYAGVDQMIRRKNGGD